MTPKMITDRFMQLTVRVKALEEKVAALEAAKAKPRTKKATKEE